MKELLEKVDKFLLESYKKRIKDCSPEELEELNKKIQEIEHRLHQP